MPVAPSLALDTSWYFTDLLTSTHTSKQGANGPVSSVPSKGPKSEGTCGPFVFRWFSERKDHSRRHVARPPLAR